MMRKQSESLFILAGGLDMKKISYSKDADALLIALSEDPIAYADEED